LQTDQSESAVLFEVTDSVARITLNRPAKYNAMNMRFALDFQAAVAAVAERSDIAVVVLCANGPAFCAGGDLEAMFEADDLQEYFTTQAEALHGGIGQLSSLPVVVVAAVSGVVAGGGLGLVLTGDLIVAGENTTFTPAYPRLGFTPDCGVTAQLPRAVGLRRALQYTVGGKKLDAAEALEWGLVSEVVETDRVLTRALELAHTVATSASGALGETRSLVRSSFDRDLQTSLDLEATTIVARTTQQESIDLVARFAAARGARR
jgi:2-(1,2-epoxy-1,2-dihydrophenyl)acetyl-CoA isomerase